MALESREDIPQNSTDPDTPRSLTEELVSLCARPVIERDLDRAATLLLDWVGNAIAATREGSSRWAFAWATGTASPGPCISLGAGLQMPENAAFLNGSLGTLLEMDDLHRASLMHASDVVIPAALAAAQFHEASPKRLLQSILLGYEVALRISTAAAKGGYTGWYNSGTCGTFGAAMAASHAAGLSDIAKLDALGQAGMMAAGIWQARLETTDSKALATAHAARAGFTAAQVAQHGCRGPRKILEGPLGFFNMYYPQADPSLVADNPSASWLIHQVSLKPWSACRHVHPAIDLALALRQELTGQEIASITVKTYAAALDFCDNDQPQTAHEARFSMQHCVAVALLNGNLELSDSQKATRDEARVAKLRKQIRLCEDPELSRAFPLSMGAGLEVTTREGGRYERETLHALGDPEQPLGGDDLLTKFRTNLEWANVPKLDSDELVAAIKGLRQAETLARFNRTLGTIAKLTASTRQEELQQ